MTKKLYRSTEHKVLAGVLGGVGEYLDTDPNAIRLIYTLVTVFTGFFPGIIAYVFGVLILPSRAISPVHTPPEAVNDHPEV